MKKKFLCMLLAGTLALSVTACGKKGDENPNPTPTGGAENSDPTQPVEVDFSVKEQLQSILDKASTVALMEGGEMELTELYKIDPSKVEEYSIRVPMMNVHATEFAMFKAASAEDVDAIVAGINTRIEALEGVWANYLPDQMALVENRKVLTQGNYVFFIVAEEDVSAYAENVFLRKFDPSIEEYVLLRKFDRVENGTITAISENGLTLEMEEDGTTYIFECTYSDGIYLEVTATDDGEYVAGKISDYAVGDKVLATFEEEVTEGENPMHAVLAYMGPVIE